jgi:hypothetical protein
LPRLRSEGHDQRWIYFSVRDDRDNGTIVDFVQKRKGVQLGGVRQELRPWAGSVRTVRRAAPNLFAQDLAPITKDRARVLLELARMKPLAGSRYLDEERKIPAALLRAGRGNAIFPPRRPRSFRLPGWAGAILGALAVHGATAGATTGAANSRCALPAAH